MLYYLGNYRTEEQRSEMARLEADSICVFCPDNLMNDRDHVVMWRSRYWTVIPNRYPYKGARQHLLLVPHEHETDLLDLSPAAKEDFWAALGWVRDNYEMTYYGIGVRNGDCQFTGGTIRHVHVHVLVGDVDDPQHEPIRMKLSSRPKPGG